MQNKFWIASSQAPRNDEEKNLKSAIKTICALGVLIGLLVWISFMVMDIRHLAADADQLERIVAAEREKTSELRRVIAEMDPLPPTPEAINLGEFEITVYTTHCDGGHWGYMTATGVKSKHLTTCAVDPTIIPLGTELHINGILFTAVDTGGAVKGRKIDLFYDGTPEQARAWIGAFGTKHNVTALCER